MFRKRSKVRRSNANEISTSFGAVLGGSQTDHYKLDKAMRKLLCYPK